MLSEKLLEEKKIYLICATPRSGSNLLCDLLWNSEVMGNPQEYINIEACVLRFSKQYNLLQNNNTISFDRYFENMIKNFSSTNNVFGMKFLFDQFEPLANSQVLKTILKKSKFIWLSRQDKVAQAVSMYIAKQTNDWNSNVENKTKRAALEYDESKIAYFLNYLVALDVKWINFFAINQIKYLPITYEELLDNSNRVCQKICDYCEVKNDYNFSLKKASLKKQGDDLNQSFIDTFIRNSDLNLDRVSDCKEFNYRNVKLLES